MGTAVIWETNELSMNNSLLFLARADKILNHELLMNSSWIVHGSENRFYTMNSSWFTVYLRVLVDLMYKSNSILS